jgi:hypothetical protein
VKYFLVLLSDVRGGVLDDSAADSHEPFIDSLIARNAVLLGGGFETPVNGFSAAYVLAAKDIATATALAHEDPLVRDARATCDVTEWRLVGINTAAIDPSQTIPS